MFDWSCKDRLSIDMDNLQMLRYVRIIVGLTSRITHLHIDIVSRRNFSLNYTYKLKK